ncbi:MAG: adenine phosphoribosyltransferase [Candidatus Dadabacteria bacterium]|nr:adenine phosphoribosyltransferase [Candidatus Dadabacteria bacterium]NIQ14656.1 adenine phosphoribosyltransferase [Candidatus Dadabacteria bacterium]
MITDEIKKLVRDIPDFPKEGITFHDITPLLQNASGFEKTINVMADMLKNQDINTLIGIEARGFIFASALSLKLQTGLVVIRKPGKLPYVTIDASYDLEYGQDTLEIHKDAITDETRAVIVDDLLATGGTAAAAGQLIEELGGHIVGYTFLIELTGLKGADNLRPYPIWSVMKFPY